MRAGVQQICQGGNSSQYAHAVMLSVRGDELAEVRASVQTPGLALNILADET